VSLFDRIKEASTKSEFTEIDFPVTCFNCERVSMKSQYSNESGIMKSKCERCESVSEIYIGVGRED
jgi:phage FluMu protein Com